LRSEQEPQHSCMLDRRYINRKHGIEYISVEKAACTSIKAALLIADGIEPPEELSQVHYHPHWFRQWFGAVPIRWVFTFVRDPRVRLVSLWWDMVRTGRSREFMADLPASMTFSEFVRWIVARNELPNRHYAPQTLVLSRSRNGDALDFVGHIETISEDWRVVQAHAPGLGELPHRNASDRPKDWRALYDPETWAIAGGYYAGDLRRWPRYALPNP